MLYYDILYHLVRMLAVQCLHELLQIFQLDLFKLFSTLFRYKVFTVLPCTLNESSYFMEYSKKKKFNLTFKQSIIITITIHISTHVDIFLNTDMFCTLKVWCLKAKIFTRYHNEILLLQHVFVTTFTFNYKL